MNLVEGVHLRDFERDLQQGSGNELGVKFRAAYSSSALAVKTFAPFKANPSALQLDASSSFSKLTFERKCPNGMGTTPPNLDVLLEGESGVTAIESKCLEPLRLHVAEISLTYDRKILDGRRDSSWFAEMHRLIMSPRSYRWLDAAQLVKHALGLGFTFPGQTVKLLYLFWEPSDASDHKLFGEHRGEIAQFAESVSGDRITFAAMPYRDLWADWEASSSEPWLKTHVGRLRARYDVACGRENDQTSFVARPFRMFASRSDFAGNNECASRLRPSRATSYETREGMPPISAAFGSSASTWKSHAQEFPSAPISGQEPFLLDLLTLKNLLSRGSKLARTGLTLNPENLAIAYREFLVQPLPRRRKFLSLTRNGITSSGGYSNRQEEHLAVALFQGKTIEMPNGGSIQLADYQFPLKAVQADVGIGKVDLLGVDQHGAVVVIELKVGRSREDRRLALVEALIYAAIVEANILPIASELEAHLKRPIRRSRPEILLLAPTAYWSAGDRSAVQEVRTLATKLSVHLGVSVQTLCLDAELTSYGLLGARPHMSGQARCQALQD